jgi:hypothetical protein
LAAALDLSPRTAREMAEQMVIDAIAFGKPQPATAS